MVIVYGECWVNVGVKGCKKDKKLSRYLAYYYV